ncbi:phage regulatory CII family protein [Burkholderia glumae]|uniref:phage regulatory CII family protein n=1 Tax=Burkholderia glumae TaxID=337 RepID=UPI002037114F|nr:phage regulatory CII family protein [Burkholderia glumae]MCM2537688.1 phage regulatory CII family protein [Burkholderia glumae]
MNILDAAHKVIHGYPGGCESLAPRLGMAPQVLRNKANPNTESHHLTLMNVVVATELTDDDLILKTWARERGYLLVKMPTAESCSDGEVVELMAKTWETNGDIGREVNKTLEDGRVEAHEVAKIERSAWDHFSAVVGLVGRIRGMVEPR